MDDMESKVSSSTQFLLGEISAKLSAINDGLIRFNVRMDSLEVRLEKLEQVVNTSRPWVAVLEKAVWGVLGAAGILGLKAAGML